MEQITLIAVLLAALLSCGNNDVAKDTYSDVLRFKQEVASIDSSAYVALESIVCDSGGNLDFFIPELTYESSSDTIHDTRTFSFDHSGDRVELRQVIVDHIVSGEIYVRGVRCETHDLIIGNSAPEFPFDISGYTDYATARFARLKVEDRSYLVLISSPMNWTGVFSSKYVCYHLVDLENKQVYRTVAIRCD